ncbi:hypothetical protein WA026_018343, partial [Henosepilachna vigintioctopunctata]
QNNLHKSSEWKQLWYPNLEDFTKAEASISSENNTVTNITVQLGATAFLHCHVRSTNDRTLAGSEQVSWVRRRDWHILSSGVFTYTNDERFQILHAEGSDDWTLQIKYVQKRDNGTYECQKKGPSQDVDILYYGPDAMFDVNWSVYRRETNDDEIVSEPSGNFFGVIVVEGRQKAFFPSRLVARTLETLSHQIGPFVLTSPQKFAIEFGANRDGDEGFVN